MNAGPDTEAGERRGPVDADVCFLVHAYRDFDDLVLCVHRLRRAYPGARLIVVADGDDDPRYRLLEDPEFYDATPGVSAESAIEAAAATTLVYGERLFTVERGGEIVHRMLDLYLRTSAAPCLLKIDTDSHVHRRFRWLPRTDGCFGTLQTAKRGGSSVQGGCMGFPRRLAIRLLDSGVFLDEELKVARIEGETRHLRSWVRNEAMRRRVEEDGLTSIDWVVGHVARKVLPFRFVEFDEVRCLYRHYVPNPGLKWAVTHPCLEKCLRHGYVAPD